MLRHGKNASLKLSDHTIAFGPSPFNQANPDFDPQLIDTIRAWLELTVEHRGRATFLDVGCGTGAVMSLVKRQVHGVKVVGLEIDPASATASKAFGDVIVCDARTYNGYGKYDAIFMYRPLATARQQFLLEQRIIDQAAVNTLLVSVLPQHPRFFSDSIKGAFIK